MYHQPSPAKALKNLVVGSDSDAKQQPGEEGDHREPVRQALFQRKSNNALKIPNGYLNVAVLIIRWDQSIDDFKGHTEEIDRLQGIFEHNYGYSCKVHSIKNLKKPQVDLNLAILNHIHEHDDPNNLLIFYYTGHGNQSSSGLELAASDNIANVNGSHIPTAFWNSAEKPILGFMDGDALSILDCCMASTAGMKGRNDLIPRNYQLLAASAADAPTCGPGQNSFTTALCESLIELLDEAKGDDFQLVQLCERINTKRKSQACLSWDRLRTFKRSMQLGRLEQSTNLEDSFGNEDPEKSLLTLRLTFRTSDLEDKQIERLAEQLPHACHMAKVPLRRIDWVKMKTVNHEMGRTPSMHHTVSFGTADYNPLEFPSNTFFVPNENGIFGPTSVDFYAACRRINAAQKFRSAVNRRRASKPQLCHESAGVMALKPLTLLFTFSLSCFRRDKVGLALWIAFLVLMFGYGPCIEYALGPIPVVIR